MIIKKIFEGVFDEEVHNSFLKFGRGDFKNKFMVAGKKQATKWAIKTGPEFANFFVKNCLEKLGEGKIAMKGVVISTMDLSEEISFEIVKKKNFKGIRQLVIDTEVDSKEILDFMEKYPKIFFALSFKCDDFELKIKAKPPKNAKPGKKDGEGPKVDFCSLKTTDENILKELFFDVGLNWKEIKINHSIIIEDIIYPKDATPEEMRKNSKRKGKVVRTINLDDVEKVSEAEFEV